MQVLPMSFLVVTLNSKKPGKNIVSYPRLKSRSFLPYLASLAQINGTHPARPTDRQTQTDGIPIDQCPVGIIREEKYCPR